MTWREVSGCEAMRSEDLQKQFDALVPHFRWGSAKMDMSMAFSWCKREDCLEACEFIIAQTKKMIALKDQVAISKVCQDTWDVITGKREPTPEEWPLEPSEPTQLKEVDSGFKCLRQEGRGVGI